MPTSPPFGVALPAKDARISALETGAAIEPPQRATPSDMVQGEGQPSRMQILGRISIVIVVTAVAAAIGVAASLGIGTGWRAYTVYGGSMQPQYAQGDLIFTSSSSVGNVKPGQIIVFTADWASEKYEQRVVHRVAAVGTVDGVPFAYTRGDANSVDDPLPVDLRSEDVSVVRFSVSNGAFWMDVITAPYSLALIFATLGIAVAGIALSAGLSPRSVRNTNWLKTPATASQQSSAGQQERF